MKAIVVVLAMLLVVRAEADYLPDGCYVAFHSPGSCWQSSNGITLWTPYQDRAAGVFHYGFAVETIINVGYNAELDKKVAEGNLYACTNSLNSTESNRQEWIAYAKNQESLVTTKSTEAASYLADFFRQQNLVKKLRRKCGRPCKSVK